MHGDCSSRTRAGAEAENASERVRPVDPGYHQPVIGQYIWLVHIYPAIAWLVCVLGRLQTISTSKQIGKNIGRVRDSEAGSILFHFFCQNFIYGGFHNRSVQLQWI